MMISQVKDPAIKLFGKTIPLPPPPSPYEEAPSVLKTTTLMTSADSDDHEQQQRHSSSSDFHGLVPSTTCASSLSSPKGKFCSRVGDGEEDRKNPSESEVAETRLEDGSTSQPTSEQLKDPAALCEDPKTLSVDKEPISPKVSKNDEQSEASISQERALKKPDKILPCPRCSSMETKFCYYNNYNLSQPRHFCKNCQRYWTAGGTMRNVPVGSGRRKNKSSFSSNFHHIMVSEDLEAGQDDTSNDGIQHPTLRTNNGTFLTFGLNAPSVLENGDDHLNISSVKASYSAEKGGNNGLQESIMKNSQALLPLQAPCFPGPSWPCPWNSPHWRPAIAPPVFTPFGFPMTFYPLPPYWGCALPGLRNVQWLPPPPASTESAIWSGSNSLTLGKHSRDGEMLKQSDSQTEEPLKENNSERCIWIPKTLRIDDPSVAAKSSIWSTLEINNESDNNSIDGDNLFKALQSKGDEKNQRAEKSLAMLRANPAALSRSLNFHESAY
ncbi:hypothetical protein U1Q18_016864 [Sarracenia purpurea var. burkii]